MDKPVDTRAVLVLEAFLGLQLAGAGGEAGRCLEQFEERFVAYGAGQPARSSCQRRLLHVVAWGDNMHAPCAGAGVLLGAAGGGTSAAQASSVAAAIQEAVVGGGSGTLVEVRSRDAAEIKVRGRLAGFAGESAASVRA